jgi:Icc-related predicted phosphoesterase
MKIQVLADLHLEFADYRIKFAEDADVLVIAGDVTTANSLLKLVALARTTKKPIVFVAGNHEYYGGNFDEVNRELERIRSYSGNFHFLNNGSLCVDDVQFIGSTLWSNFDLAPNPVEFARFIRPLISDFDCITKSSTAKFSPHDCLKLNQESRSFLKDEISSSFTGKKVVVTHFCPSPKSIHPVFDGDTANPYFCCNCEDLMGSSVPLWVHGHTHQSIDYKHGNTHVIANPKGYFDENIKFNGELVTEI